MSCTWTFNFKGQLVISGKPDDKDIPNILLQAQHLPHQQQYNLASFLFCLRDPQEWNYITQVRKDSLIEDTLEWCRRYLKNTMIYDPASDKADKINGSCREVNQLTKAQQEYQDKYGDIHKEIGFTVPGEDLTTVASDGGNASDLDVRMAGSVESETTVGVQHREVHPNPGGVENPLKNTSGGIPTRANALLEQASVSAIPIDNNKPDQQPLDAGLIRETDSKNDASAMSGDAVIKSEL